MKGGGSGVRFNPRLHAGLSSRAPRASDKSTDLPKGPKVGSSELRKGVAPSQKSLGPRTA